MLSSNRAIESFLSKSNVTLELIKVDDFIKEKIITYGYTDERIDEGLTLLKEADKSYQDLLSSRNEQFKLSNMVQEKSAAAGTKMVRYMDIFKTTFHDTPELVKEMGLDTQRKRAYPAFYAQVVNFYTSAMNKDHILEKVDKFGLTKEKLQQELEEITLLQGDYVRQRNLIGENQRLTQDRDLKLGRLTRYMHELKTVMSILFEKENQVLERVGIFVRNRRRPRKSEPVPAPDETLSTGPSPEPDPVESAAKPVLTAKAT
jgi:hypothetical protein